MEITTTVREIALSEDISSEAEKRTDESDAFADIPLAPRPEGETPVRREKEEEIVELERPPMALRENDLPTAESLSAVISPETAEAPQKPEIPDELPAPPHPEPKPEQLAAIPVETNAKPEFRVIGVAFKTYILVETGDTLVMIDQHAAHERLRYEQYVKALADGVASQRLLAPILVRVTAHEMQAVAENMELLRQLGYDVEPFGNADLRVTAVPFIMGHTDARPMILETIGALGGMKSMALAARREEIMQLSCKGAVKGGDALTDSEISSLIADMLASGAPPTCPHGRPVARTLTRRELERVFKRIQ
jgi:DNA mismatch repair protein MutL